MDIKLLLLILTSFFCTSAFASLEAGSNSNATVMSGSGRPEWHAGRCYIGGTLVSAVKCDKPIAYNKKQLALCINILQQNDRLMEEQWHCPGSGEVFMGGKHQQALCYEHCTEYYIKNFATRESGDKQASLRTK